MGRGAALKKMQIYEPELVQGLGNAIYPAMEMAWKRKGQAELMTLEIVEQSTEEMQDLHQNEELVKIGGPEVLKSVAALRRQLADPSGYRLVLAVKARHLPNEYIQVARNYPCPTCLARAQRAATLQKAPHFNHSGRSMLSSWSPVLMNFPPFGGNMPAAHAPDPQRHSGEPGLGDHAAFGANPFTGHSHPSLFEHLRAAGQETTTVILFCDPFAQLDFRPFLLVFFPFVIFFDASTPVFAASLHESVPYSECRANIKPARDFSLSLALTITVAAQLVKGFLRLEAAGGLVVG
eukprot:s3600_g9.t1